jgi:ATP phosphoribosyltransferase
VLRAENKQNERYADLVAQIQQVVSDSKIQEVKFNARFDMLNKPTSQKTDENNIVNFVAICNNNKLQIVKKRLVKFRLV